MADKDPLASKIAKTHYIQKSYTDLFSKDRQENMSALGNQALLRNFRYREKERNPYRNCATIIIEYSTDSGAPKTKHLSTMSFGNNKDGKTHAERRAWDDASKFIIKERKSKIIKVKQIAICSDLKPCSAESNPCIEFFDVGGGATIGNASEKLVFDPRRDIFCYAIVGSKDDVMKNFKEAQALEKAGLTEQTKQLVPKRDLTQTHRFPMQSSPLLQCIENILQKCNIFVEIIADPTMYSLISNYLSQKIMQQVNSEDDSLDVKSLKEVMENFQKEIVDEIRGSNAKALNQAHMQTLIKQSTLTQLQEALEKDFQKIQAAIKVHRSSEPRQEPDLGFLDPSAGGLGGLDNPDPLFSKGRANPAPTKMAGNASDNTIANASTNAPATAAAKEEPETTAVNAKKSYSKIIQSDNKQAKTATQVTPKNPSPVPAKMAGNEIDNTAANASTNAPAAPAAKEEPDASSVNAKKSYSSILHPTQNVIPLRHPRDQQKKSKRKKLA